MSEMTNGPEQADLGGIQSGDLDDRRYKALLEEYRQLCEDWKARDGYVQSKFFSAAVVLFTVGQVFAQMPSMCPGDPWRLAIGIYFLFVSGYMLAATVSAIKDVYYRDATGKLLQVLQAELGLDEYFRDHLERLALGSLELRGKGPPLFRKLKATRRAVGSLGFPTPLQDALAAVPTYKLLIPFLFVCGVGAAAAGLYTLVALARWWAALS